MACGARHTRGPPCSNRRSSLSSRSYFSTSVSKHPNTSLRRPTNRSGVMPAAIGVNPTTSANRMLAASWCAAMVRRSTFSASEISWQDVEQQPLGAILEEVALPDEVVQQAGTRSRSRIRH